MQTPCCVPCHCRDPLTGVYTGVFGPHGPELLLMERQCMDGEEWVTATKLTGDEVKSGWQSEKVEAREYVCV